MMVILAFTLVVTMVKSLSGLPIGVGGGAQRCLGDSPSGPFSEEYGGVRTALPEGVQFSCPECTGRKYLCINEEQCFLLSSSSVNLFVNGTISSPPIALDELCSPLSILTSAIGENVEKIFIQCHSTGPNFSPMYEVIKLAVNGSWVKLPLRAIREGFYPFANSTDNSVIIGGQTFDGLQNTVLSLRADRQTLTVHFDGDPQEKGTISLTEWCDTVHDIRWSHPLEVRLHNIVIKQPHFIADCVKSGQQVRMGVTLSFFNVAIDRQNTFPLQHTTGEVFTTPQYYLFQDERQITLVDRYNHDSLQATKAYPSSISSVSFLNDEWLLVEMDGSDRKVINVTNFIHSRAEEGEYTLPDSTAYCPDSVCPASELVNDVYLLLFVRDEDNHLYLDRFLYDLSNLTTGPTRVSRMLTSDFPVVCFSSEGVTTATPPTDPTTIETSATSFIPTTSTSNAPSSQRDSHRDVYSLLVLLIVPLVVASCLVTLAVVYLYNRKQQVHLSQEETSSQGTPPPTQIEDELPSTSSGTSGYSTSSDRVTYSQTVQEGNPRDQMVVG